MAIEYGGELSAILGERTLTPSSLVNVILCGIGQRVRYAEAWQMGGIALAIWLVVGTIANSVSPLSQSTYNHFFQVELIAELAIGYIYASRSSKHVLAAAIATAKASLLGITPELLIAALWAANLIHPTILGMNGSPHIHGHLITELCFRTEAGTPPADLLMVIPFTVVTGFLVGMMGATIAMAASATRSFIVSRK